MNFRRNCFAVYPPDKLANYQRTVVSFIARTDMEDILANQGNDDSRNDHPYSLKILNREQVSELKKLDIRIPANLRLMPAGNICLLQVDAIVNSANECLTGGGGLDEIIHKMAGHGLSKECSFVSMNHQGVRCFTGDAVITGKVR